MKNYAQFGIYDFSDFAEELESDELIFVNGGSCGGGCGGGASGGSVTTSSNSISISTCGGGTVYATGYYGTCAGGTVTSAKTYSSSVGTCGGAFVPSYQTCGGGGVPASIPSWNGYGKQYEWADDFGDNFANNACAATSLLNELSEQYTKETGKILTKEQRSQAIKNAYDSGSLRKTDAFIKDWTKTANNMAEVIGLKGKYTYVQNSSNPDAKIYAWDKTGDGYSDHFVNDIGNGYYYDPATGKTGRVDNLQLATKDNLGKYRTLEYN